MQQMPDGGKGYKVLGDELTTHAGKVEEFGSRLDSAVEAAQQVTMDNSAYGVICQPFALLLDPFEQMGVDALRKGAESFGDTAGKVKDAASKYAETEGEMTSAVQDTGSGL